MPLRSNMARLIGEPRPACQRLAPEAAGTVIQMSCFVMRRVRPLPLRPDGRAGSRAAIAELPAQCHGMSCFPCGGCICDGRFGHDAAVSDGRSGCSIRFPGFGLRHVSLLSIHLRSVLPAARLPRRRDPLSRAFACGRGRVSASARFARLIARVGLRARARRRAHLACWPNRGLFSRRRERRNEAASRTLLPPSGFIFARVSKMSSDSEKFS